MSYILDALKKDKNTTSKDHDSIPDLSSEHAIYELEEEKSLSRWIWPVVVMLLILTIIVLLFMLFNPSSKQFAQYLEQKPQQEQAETIVVSEQDKAQTNQSMDNIENISSEQQANSMVVSKPLQVGTPVVERVQRRPNSTTPAKSSPPASNETGTIANNASGEVTKADLPTLVYTTHIYATLPKDRFVMLNGRPYAEGDRISEGLRVKSILENDLVVTFKGKEFILPSLEDVNVGSP